MTDRRTYVLDTSVLLSDPKALTKFDEHDVVLPVVVVRELEAKRGHPELGWAARTVLRHLEQLRVSTGDILTPVKVNEQGGTVRIELNHQDDDVVPEALRGKANDDRILTVACNLKANDGLDVVLVSKDLPLRLIGSLADIEVEDYRNNQADNTDDYHGLIGPYTVDDGTLAKVFDADTSGVLLADIVPDLNDTPPNAGIILQGATGGSALVRLHADGRIRPVPDRRLGKIRGNSAEQKLAIDMLDDPTVPIVSLGGAAGTGKTFLAIQAGLESVDRGDHDRVLVLRSVQEVGGEKIGYMPGDLREKMAEPAQAVIDALEAATNPQRAKLLLDNGTVQILPVTHLRGRTITGTYLVVDEAQNHEARTLLTVLSRAGGPGTRGARCATKVVLTHDVAQRDNLHVGRFDGVAAVVAKLTRAKVAEFGTVSLKKSERSRVAEIATSLLDDGN